MNTKHQWTNLRSEKNRAASFLIWFISGLYLLGMVGFLLSTVGDYSAQDTPPWLVQQLSRALSPTAFLWCCFGRLKTFHLRSRSGSLDDHTNNSQDHLLP